jgi:hypothetical protein
VIALVWKWILTFPSDFGKPSILPKFLKFIIQMADDFPSAPATAQKLKKSFQICQAYIYNFTKNFAEIPIRRSYLNSGMRSSRASSRISTVSNAANPPETSDHSKTKHTILDFPAEELAEAFTIREYDLLSAVTSEMLILNLFNGRDPSTSEITKPIQESIDNFNTVTIN